MPAPSCPQSSSWFRRYGDFQGALQGMVLLIAIAAATARPLVSIPFRVLGSILGAGLGIIGAQPGVSAVELVTSRVQTCGVRVVPR
jgi:hypothetical protein